MRESYYVRQRQARWKSRKPIADRSNFYFLTHVFHPAVCQVLCMLIVPNTFLRSIYFLLAERLRICIIFIWSFTAFASGEETFRFSFSFLSLSLPIASPPPLFLSLFLSFLSFYFPFALFSCIGRVWENYRCALLYHGRVSPFREPHVSVIIDNR